MVTPGFAMRTWEGLASEMPRELRILDWDCLAAAGVFLVRAMGAKRKQGVKGKREKGRWWNRKTNGQRQLESFYAL